MSRSARVRLLFGGQVRNFKLGIGELEELQELCGAGPRVVLSRIQTGAWKTYDLKETLRLGLIGGGELSPTEAHKLADRYVRPPFMIDSEKPALMVLAAALIGSSDGDGKDADPAGEMTGETTANASPMES